MTRPLDLQVQHYFLDFLGDKRDRQLLPNVQNLCVRFAINILRVTNGIWTLQLTHGVLSTVDVGSLKPQCSFQLDAETFLNIASGELSPQYAFFQRRIEISGRIDMGLRVATVLAGFFKMYPYHPPEFPE